MNWLDKLERKFGRFCIKGLMTYIVALNGFVFILMYLSPSGNLIEKLFLDPAAVMRGEVWRLVTYIFIPPEASPIWIIFVLYFYYMVGTGLEQEWGSFRFNVYYFIGMIATTVISFVLGGFGTATYLNLSLFLAFARIYPDYEILLFFILPVKVKYLAYLDWAVFAFAVVFGSMESKVLAIVSLLNYFIFFGKDIVMGRKAARLNHQNRQRFKPQLVKMEYRHKCTVCGVTERENPNMEFRYCSKCEGTLCYCEDHIHTHTHVKK